MKNGYFITFEGPDGSGKSTALEKVAQYFENENIAFVKTREPGGSNIAQQIRNILLSENNKELSSTTEALLFAASRAQHFDEVIVPALKQGKVVLCDRFIDSSLAYQAYARGLGFEQILAINNFAIKEKMPDLTIFFDISPKLGLERIQANGEREVNRLDLEGLKFHELVYKGYQKVIAMYPNRFAIIDASQNKDDVLKDVISIIKEKLNG